MSTGLKWFIALVATIFIAIAALFFAIRYHDGPMEIISGGPFKTGTLVTDVNDWSFLEEHQTIEMQTMIPPRSRTMWIIVSNNRPFIVSGYMKTAVGKVWKQWPRTIEEDDRAIIRVEGNLYEFTLERIQDGPIVDPVIERFNEKYGMGYTRETIESGANWLFELAPR